TEQQPVAEQPGEDTALPPETLALMASLPPVTPPAPQQVTTRPGEQSAPATPAISATDTPPAPLPATPRTTAELPATPMLAEAVQRQAEQAGAPMISTPRDNAAPMAGLSQTPASTPPVTLNATLP